MFRWASVTKPHHKLANLLKNLDARNGCVDIQQKVVELIETDQKYTWTVCQTHLKPQILTDKTYNSDKNSIVIYCNEFLSN